MDKRTPKQFSPPVDLLEVGDKWIVRVEIAGMRGDDFDIQLVNRTLSIAGFRQRPQFESPIYHQVEIGSGEFYIQIHLPGAIDEGHVTASYEQGFLEIALPRRPEQRVRVREHNREGYIQDA